MDTTFFEYQGTFGRGRTLDSIVDMVEALPPLPDVARNALNLIDDPDSTADQLAAILKRDPALASMTLRVANSAAMGSTETISELAQAIMVIGLTTLRSKLLAASLKTWNKFHERMDELVWDKSLGTAAAAQAIATHLDKPYQSEAHLSGLLHNLGQVVMLTLPEVRKEYPSVLDYIRENSVDYTEAERNVIGFSYPLVGALVARRWNLPYSVCVCALRHVEPYEFIENKQDELVVVTKLATSVATCAGLGAPEGHPDLCESFAELAIALGFDPDTLNRDKEIIVAQTRTLYSSEAAELG